MALPVAPALGSAEQLGHPSAIGLHITASPADPQTTLPVVYTFKVHSGYTTKCKMDDGVSRSCASPKVYDNLADGPHHFVVRASKDGVHAHRADDFFLDAAGPTSPVVTATPTAWTSSNVGLKAAGSTAIGSALDHYQYRVSSDLGKTWSATTRGAAYTVSSAGRTWVDFQAVDALGRASTWTRGYAGIDRTPPAAPTVSPAACSVTDLPATLTAKTTDSGGSGVYAYKWEVYMYLFGGWTKVADHTGPTYSLPGDLPLGGLGQYDIGVWAVDRAGNEGDDTEWVNDVC